MMELFDVTGLDLSSHTLAHMRATTELIYRAESMHRCVLGQRQYIGHLQCIGGIYCPASTTTNVVQRASSYKHSWSVLHQCRNCGCPLRSGCFLIVIVKEILKASLLDCYSNGNSPDVFSSGFVRRSLWKI